MAPVLRSTRICWTQMTMSSIASSSIWTKTIKSIVLCLVLLMTVAACTLGKPMSPGGTARSEKSKLSKYFRPVGRLNCDYNPGVFVPLRNGKVLALDGFHGDRDSIVRADDGMEYGFAYGLTELFDPVTGQTKILTRMPFRFNKVFETGEIEMRAIELADGRIFMVGWFMENRTKSPGSLEVKSCGGGERPVILPYYGKINHKIQLRSIAPCTEPKLFGVIYDWRRHAFELINAPPEIPPRCGVTMNLLSNGKVLIMGGSISGYASYLEFPETRVLLFDPTTKKFELVGNLLHPRIDHETLALHDQQFLLFNGVGASQVEWKQLHPFAYRNGVVEGYTRHSRTLEVEMFDVTLRQSKIVGHTLNRRVHFSVIPLPDTKVFIHGGPLWMSSMLGYEQSELYNPKTGTTVFVGERRKPRVQHYIEAEFMIPYYLFGEDVYFKAARKGENLVLAGADMAFIYNYHDLSNPDAIKNNVIRDCLAMPRIRHHMVTAIDGRIFVMGGHTFSKFTGSTVKGERPAKLVEEFIYPGIASDMRNQK